MRCGRMNKAFVFGAMMLAGIVLLWGCPKKPEEAAMPETQTAQTAGDLKKGEVSTSAERATAAGGGLQPVYFDFDKSVIRNDARDALKANADWLKANPGVKVRIEGNCDERGTIEYNQALGQRRASVAGKYLKDMGVSGSRISLISYGAEKPLCAESTEECWQKNRKDDFIMVSE